MRKSLRRSRFMSTLTQRVSLALTLIATLLVMIMGGLAKQSNSQLQAGGLGSGGNPLAYVPRLLIGLLDDVRTIATSVTVLPEVARSLATIEARVTSMDEEVRRMRQGVDGLGGGVGR